MQAINAKGSKIETALAKALYAKGLRYRKNNSNVFGKPDLTFKKIKLAVFVDGEFWHGKDWENRKHDHKSNQDFWHKKIESNMARDRIVDARLQEEGWTVLRFWGTDIKKDLEGCVRKVVEVVESRLN